MIETYQNVVIGSGFGGSAAALRIAEMGEQVLILERGMAHPPGSFKRSPQDFSKNFWDPSKNLKGLFHIFLSKKLACLTASGLGGGSLIYANVLVRKPKDSFFVIDSDTEEQKKLPFNYEELIPHYERIEKLLGVETYPHKSKPVEKLTYFKKSAEKNGFNWVPAPLGVSFSNTNGEPINNNNLFNFNRKTCTLCGECIFGCNIGAKNSLDLTILSKAKSLGAIIKTLSEVRYIRQASENSYFVSYLDHTETKPSLKTINKKRILIY